MSPVSASAFTTMERSKEETSIKVSSKNFEDVLEEIGGFGLFQFMILVLLLILEIPAAFIAFTPVFAGHLPDQWYCDALPVSKTDICSCNGTRSGTPDTSIVTEWNLVCGSAWVSDFTTSIQMAGMFLGNLVGCKISDWYGRRYTFLGVTALMGIGQGVSAVAFDPYSYGIARFISGVGLSGFLGVTSVYSMEFLTPRFRPISSGLSPWGQGVMLLALIAYYIRPWRQLLWATSLPFALIIAIFPFVPESPRWLMRNRKISQAHKVLRYMAKVNGKHPVDLGTLQAIADSEVAPVDNASSTEGNIVVKQFGYREFFRDRTLRLPTLYQMLIMCSTAITYYGISLNVKNMKGSPYFIVTLLGLSDAIGYPSALLISNRLGRRTSLAIYMTLGALSLASLAVVELSLGLAGLPTLVVVLCLLGKFCVAGGRSCARTLVGELYPTAVRAMGSGLGGVGASLGGVLAPQLVFIGSYWPAVPYFVFACIAILGALFSFLLTETMNRPLTDQILPEPDSESETDTVIMGASPISDKAENNSISVIRLPERESQAYSVHSLWYT